MTECICGYRNGTPTIANDGVIRSAFIECLRFTAFFVKLSVRLFVLNLRLTSPVSSPAMFDNDNVKI